MIRISDKFEVKRVIKKTTANFFSELKVGDRIEIFVEIKPRSGNINAQYLKVYDHSKGKMVVKSFTQLSSILKCFELVKVESGNSPSKDNQ